tara:strand:+ start:255 stop:632 length:378 start_codon:yes stop_codon:yes gene_type:complete
MDDYLQKTTLLNFTHSRLIDLVEGRGWLNLPKQQQIREIFEYVKNEIVFGYNKVCNVPASRVLLDGYGVFDCPDDFYQQHTANLTMLKVCLFKHLVRNQTNNKLSQIRQGYDGKYGALNVSRAGQ